MSNLGLHLHFYGDSNIRRSLKTITTGGKFCRTNYDTYSKECQCNDKTLDVPYYNFSKPINYFPELTGFSNTSIYFHDLKGLLLWNGINWNADLEKSRLDKIMLELGIDKVLPSAVIVGLSKDLSKLIYSKLGCWL
jgi:hypothetical protein